MEPGISIIICNYNSRTLIKSTLGYIFKQNIENDFSIELLIIDNGSTDNSFEFAIEIWKNFSSPIGLRTFRENKPGKTNAMKLAFDEAKYEYIIVCDQDNWLDQNYCLTAFQIMNENPGIGILGSQSFAECEIEPPYWFERISGAYAVGRQNENNGLVNVVWGAGMVIRKEALDKLKEVNFEFLLSDRIGNKLSAGGDDELCWAIKMLGYKIWYDERLKLKHYMPKNRLNENYIKALIKSTTYTPFILQPYQYIIENPEKQIAKRKLWIDEGLSELKILVIELIHLLPLKCYYRRDIPRNFRYLLFYRKRFYIALFKIFKANNFVKNSIQIQNLKYRINAK